MWKWKYHFGFPKPTTDVLHKQSFICWSTKRADGWLSQTGRPGDESEMRLAGGPESLLFNTKFPSIPFTPNQRAACCSQVFLQFQSPSFSSSPFLCSLWVLRNSAKKNKIYFLILLTSDCIFHQEALFAWLEMKTVIPRWYSGPFFFFHKKRVKAQGNPNPQ